MLGTARVSEETIRYVFHPSFDCLQAQREWEVSSEEMKLREKELGHMPDDVTKYFAKRMHYAAHRAVHARTPRERRRWSRRYYDLRDQVILGNRKLIFRAVRKKLYQNQAADDLIGECYLVMIRAVAAFNPWLGIRFSTYAFTCLMRALSRLNQKSLADRLSQSLSLDQLQPEDSPLEVPSDSFSLDEFFHETHPLLSSREKVVLRRRFHLGKKEDSTLEAVGRELGISKERVRQVQESALLKLRQALLGRTSWS